MKKTEKELLERAKLINLNVRWWAREMSKLEKELDETNLLPVDEAKERVSALEIRLNELIGRGENEIRLIDKWGLDLEKLLCRRKKEGI